MSHQTCRLLKVLEKIWGSVIHVDGRRRGKAGSAKSSGYVFTGKPPGVRTCAHVNRGRHGR